MCAPAIADTYSYSTLYSSSGSIDNLGLTSDRGLVLALNNGAGLRP